MNCDFRIVALTKDDFLYLLDLSEEELRLRNIVKMVVDSNPGYPCRLSLKDAEVGHIVYCLSYQHHQANSPYAASGPIFIDLSEDEKKLEINELPEVVLKRKLSLRCYDVRGLMIDAHLTQSGEISSEMIHEILENELIAYIDIHNAVPGCFSCRILRA